MRRPGGRNRLAARRSLAKRFCASLAARGTGRWPVIASARCVRATTPRWFWTKPPSDRPLSRRMASKAPRLNWPLASLKFRRLHDRFRDELVGDAEAEGAGALVQHRLADQAGEHLPVEADAARQLRGDAIAVLAVEALHRRVVGRAELVDGDVRRANLGDDVLRRRPKDVADAPDREADDQDSEQDRGDDLPDHALAGLAQPVQHLGACIPPGRNRPDRRR